VTVAFLQELTQGGSGPFSHCKRHKADVSSGALPNIVAIHNATLLIMELQLRFFGRRRDHVQLQPVLQDNPRPVEGMDGNHACSALHETLAD